MSRNKLDFLQTSLDDIDHDLIKKVLHHAYHEGSEVFKAPLGQSGHTYLLHGLDMPGRDKHVSIRAYNSTVELLITNSTGDFLFYGRYDIDTFGIDTVSYQYFLIFQLCKSKIV